MGEYQSLYVPESLSRSFEAEAGEDFVIKACRATKSAFRDQGYACSSQDFTPAALPTDKLLVPVCANKVRSSIPATSSRFHGLKVRPSGPYEFDGVFPELELLLFKLNSL